MIATQQKMIKEIMISQETQLKANRQLLTNKRESNRKQINTE